MHSFTCYLFDNSLFQKASLQKSFFITYYFLCISYLYFNSHLQKCIYSLCIRHIFYTIFSSGFIMLNNTKKAGHNKNIKNATTKENTPVTISIGNGTTTHPNIASFHANPTAPLIPPASTYPASNPINQITPRTSAKIPSIENPAQIATVAITDATNPINFI